MEISSAPGRGCTVQLEVPLPRREVSTSRSSSSGSPEPESSSDPAHLTRNSDRLNVQRKVGFAGFIPGRLGGYGLDRLQVCLTRQYTKLGCEIVPIEEAELVVMDGRQEESELGAENLQKIKTDDIVLLIKDDHKADPRITQLEHQLGKKIRRFRKPTTPSILRESLFPDHAQDIKTDIPVANGTLEIPISTPEHCDEHGNSTEVESKLSSGQDNFPDHTGRPASSLSELWKPKGMLVEDAVASLSLGDYIPSHPISSPLRSLTPASTTYEPLSPTVQFTEVYDTHWAGSHSPPTTEGEKPVSTKVLVVEDNMINRKILVKILSGRTVSKKGRSQSLDIYEAEDGIAAVEVFRELAGPVIGQSCYTMISAHLGLLSAA